MWKIHDDRLQKIAKHPALPELFGILQANFGIGQDGLPAALSRAMPFLLSRSWGVPSWGGRNTPPGELYRFQFGPRCWSKVIHERGPITQDERRPGYEQEADRIAGLLKVARWEEPADSLSCAIAGKPECDGTSTVQIVLCWQDSVRYCVIHNRDAQMAVAFLWSNDGLTLLGEANPFWFSQLERWQTYEKPIVPLGVEEPGTSERAGQMEDFRAAVRWRYESRLDGKLDGLLYGACERLGAFAGDIALACSVSRFNDAGNDSSWLAVRRGDFAWENGVYFRSSAASIRAAPPEVHELLGLLVHLDSSRLSSAVDECLGHSIHWSDVFGLFRQNGAYYFAYCDSMEESGPVYQIDLDRQGMELCGFTDRFDWNFNSKATEQGTVPKGNVLEIVSLTEVIRRVEAGEATQFSGLPSGLSLPWMAYLPYASDL